MAERRFLLARYGLKFKKILEKISHNQSRKYQNRAQRKNAFQVQIPQSKNRGKNKPEISQKTDKSPVDQPVKNNVMGTVKPRLLFVKARLVVFREDEIEIFRPPAQQRTFLESVKSEFPD